MNAWQLAQQIKHLLAAVTWPGGSAGAVFGSRGVFVYAGATPSDDELPPAFPFAAVTIDSGTPDPDEPGLIEQRFSIAVAAEAAGDPLGEHAIIGSARADLGSSAGAGVAEVSERARAALRSLTGADGAAVVVSATGVAAPAPLGRGRHVAFESLSLTALCTSDSSYAAPAEMRRVGGVLSWKGAHCAARFDFLRFHVGYVEDTETPASTPDDFDASVYTGSATEAAATILPGRTYSVFAEYDPRGTGTAAAYSAATVGTYVVT